MRTWSYIALILLATSCEQILDIQLPEYEKKLVLNAVGSTDQHLTLYLSTNVDLLSTPSLESNVGQLRLVVNESGFVIHDSWHAVYEGHIKTAISMQKGNIYELVLQSEDYPVISAVDTVPEVVPHMEVDQLFLTGDRYQLDWSVKDTIGNQYYMLELLVKGWRINGADTIWEYRPVAFSTADPVFISRINSSGSNPNFALFQDELLGMDSRSFSANFSSEIAQINQGFNPTHLHVELKCLSQTLFLYYQRLLENNHVFGGPLDSGSQLDGNVAGGLGIFGCHTSRIVELPLD